MSYQLDLEGIVLARAYCAIHTIKALKNPFGVVESEFCMRKVNTAAVLVAVDHSCGFASSSLCEVAGVELSTAPKRPANSRPIITCSEWVPYGERTIKRPRTAAYVDALGSMLSQTLLPELEGVEEKSWHLQTVCCLLKLPTEK